MEEIDNFNFTYYIRENKTILTNENISEYILAQKSELITGNISNITNETKSELIIENMTNNINDTKNELVTEKLINISLENRSLFTTENIIDNYPQKNIKFSHIIFTDDISEKQTHLIPNKIIKNSVMKMTSENLFIDCEPGFYFPEENKLENECKPCSTLGCEKCHGNGTVDICDSCFDNYLLKFINNRLVCTLEFDENYIEYDNITFDCFKCKKDYVLYKRKCFAYSFEADYFTDEENQEIKLINLDNNHIEKIIIDDEIVNALNTFTNITIEEKGNHKAYYFIINNPKSFSYLFYDCENLLSVYFASHIKNRNITNLSNMFRFCSSLNSVDISNLETYNVNNMDYMFYNCDNLTSIDLTNLNAFNVESMIGTFMNCYSFKYLNLSNFYYKNVTSFSFIFHNCLSLTSLNLNFIYADFDTKLKYINNMFSGCENMISINLSELDLSNVENMESMFSG